MPLYNPAASASSTLTVKEEDGSPSVAGVTEIQVPNGTLTNDSGTIVSLSYPTTGGATIQYPSLKPGTPTYDFASASLDGAFSAHSSGGSFTTAHVMTQGAEWGGSAVELQFSIQMGAIYVAHADTDFDFTVGGMMLHGAETSTVMFGIAALNSAGTGVGVVAYNDNNAYLATITTWNYSANSSSTGMGHNFVLNAVGHWWMRLKRVSGTWTGYISMSGRAWDFTFATRADSIVVDRLVFGLLYNTSSTYAGRLTADYFQVDV